LNTQSQTTGEARSRLALAAYVAPLALFLALLFLNAALRYLAFAVAPEYWLYPLQTIACAAVLLYFRRAYRLLRPLNLLLTTAIAVAAFLIWISPQLLLHAPARSIGFNPDRFAATPALYWGTVVLRFARLVLVVPFVEEIFWRGFLLRYLIDENFRRVPFGTFTWGSFIVVTLAFTLSHSVADWAAAALTGMLFNLVAYRTRSLSSCIIAHAITNLLLGLWIMFTHQWGFW
jgi:CAAX prenyl protease-like protein